MDRLSTRAVAAAHGEAPVKVRRNADGATQFYCPGCEITHTINDSWDITGLPDNPTFNPSVLAQWQHTANKPMRCHSFVRDGRIQFLTDCTHDLAGQTVDLPDLPPEMAD